MVTLFISHTKENAECAAQLRQGFEAHGYTIWREPASLTTKSLTYPRTIENAILGSAAVVLVWSNSGARSEWVERNTLFAQELKKLIFPVVLDSTRSPDTLVSVTSMMGQSSCADAVALLMTLPNFPTPQSTDPLIKLYEQAAHRFTREREAAIDQAAEMLKKGEHREAVLALLEYLAHKDIIMEVSKRAQEVINNDAKKVADRRQLHPGDSRHIFGVRCKNGHVTYFDKRIVCSASKPLPRGTEQSTAIELDELHLKCEHPGCGVEVVARVDCRDYKDTK